VEVQIESGSLKLQGFLEKPLSQPLGIILFAHGSGSSRFSHRNQQVAQKLNQEGFVTLLFDLLTKQESQDRNTIFNISLLARRLSTATRWVLQNSELSHLPIGYFGASTGAAAALWAAAEFGTLIRGIVSRGGRPDLAFRQLRHVKAPTLLIVGEKDQLVVDLNQTAQKELHDSQLLIIPAATHLFEESGALEEVAQQASLWFHRHVCIKPRQVTSA